MRSKNTTWPILVNNNMAVPTSNRPWSDLRPPLSEPCIASLEQLQFSTMTPVQCATIPYFMQNKDVAVEAVTGSGKTLAFVIPIIEVLTRRTKAWSKNEVGALVITPTRELAAQIARVFEPFLPTGLSLALLIGGRDLQTDIDSINNQGAQVVVATPGRLIDLLGRFDNNLASAMKSLEVLVLDEADRLLELGFEKSITTTLSYLPKQRRTGLFSATLTQDVKALIRAGMRNPVTITVRDKQSSSDLTPTPKSLCNYYLVCAAEEKLSQLLALLDKFKDNKIIVFFATCACVSYFSDLAKRLAPSLNVLALHGRMHTKRQELFARFSSSTSAVLMCTDVMARGVDFPGVDWVIQFDPPSSAKAFVHRCGRTARMGQEGRALVMLLPSEITYVEFLELNQHIVLEQFTTEVDMCMDCVSRVREMAVSERELYEKGKRAFVSFVHFYYKHESKLIFQAKELDLVSLANGFALPHLPKMPELKGKDVSSFTPDLCPSVDIPYKNKSREKQRRENNEKRKAAAAAGKETARDKSQSKPKWKRNKEVVRVKSRRGKKRRKEDMFSDGELEELAKEARLLKKFKAGKISKEEMEASLDDLV